MTIQNNLLTIDEIISKAKKMGSSLGHGDPKVHLAYLTKLRLLPQSIRKKVGNTIIGCYPEAVISQIKKIEELKASGLTYSQIRFQLNKPSIEQNFAFSQRPQLFAPNYNSLSFLIIGLILGFLLATHNNQPLAQNIAVPSEHLVKTVEATSSSSDPIYLIAIPEQNLYKLGQTNISFLK